MNTLDMGINSLDDVASALYWCGRHEGGVTIHPRYFTEPTAGYMLGQAERGITVRVNDDGARDAIVEWVHKTAPTMAEGEYFGSWRDGAYLYCDVSLAVTTLTEALRRARETGELAVWDIVNVQEVRVAAIG